jgi:hypothetical protein
MLAGRPPWGPDGQKVILHHRAQQPNGPLDEYTAGRHRRDIPHPERVSLIDRQLFDEQRARHWVSRAWRHLEESGAARMPPGVESGAHRFPLGQRHTLTGVKDGRQIRVYVFEAGNPNPVDEVVMDQGNPESARTAARRLARYGTAAASVEAAVSRLFGGLLIIGIVFLVSDAYATVHDMSDPNQTFQMYGELAQIVQKGDTSDVAVFINKWTIKLGGPIYVLGGWITAYYGSFPLEEIILQALVSLGRQKRFELAQEIRRGIARARAALLGGPAAGELRMGEPPPPVADEDAFRPWVAPPAPAARPRPPIPFPHLTQADILHAIAVTRRDIDAWQAELERIAAHLRYHRATQRHYPTDTGQSLIEDYERQQAAILDQIQRAKDRIAEYERALGAPGRAAGTPLPPPAARPVPAEPMPDVAEGQRVRDRIAWLRDRIGDLQARLDDAEPWMEEYIADLRRAIDYWQRELERQRELARALGQDTGEPVAEPAVSPPRPAGPVFGPWGYAGRLFTDPWGRSWLDVTPPGVAPIEPQPVTVTPDGRVIDRIGLPVGRLQPLGEGTGRQSLRTETELGLLRDWADLSAAQRTGIDLAPITHRYGVDRTRPVAAVLAGMTVAEVIDFAARVRAAAQEALAARVRQRGTSAWGGFLLMPGGPIGEEVLIVEDQPPIDRIEELPDIDVGSRPGIGRDTTIDRSLTDPIADNGG